jgi:NAD-dependent dihydropyrimidine dehydrogenase PreA subunit
VDWDSCIADGACIEACPVQVFQWYRSEYDLPAVEMRNATSASIGEIMIEGEEKTILINQTDPVREHDCI